MAIITLLEFIKFAFAGTGTANDIDTLIFILIILLVLFMGIPFLVSNFRRYLLNSKQNRDENNERIQNELEVSDDPEYF